MGVFAGGQGGKQRSFLEDPNDLWCWPVEKKNFLSEEFEGSQFADKTVILFYTDFCIYNYGFAIYMYPLREICCILVLAAEKYCEFFV